MLYLPIERETCIRGVCRGVPKKTLKVVLNIIKINANHVITKCLASTNIFGIREVYFEEIRYTMIIID